METFDELIAGLDSGAANLELSKAVRDLVQRLEKRAEQTGTAKGEITLKLKFAAVSNGRVEIKQETTVKQPGLPTVHEVRWIGSGGSLVAADPRQAALDLKVPGKPKVEAK
jgi:2-phospho-L-lactate transferase/gluconeogenesis factor (CofD/UPF0052 family)